MSSQVFLFRDCAKRPSNEIDLRDGKDPLEADKIFELPFEFGVPPGWCTHKSLQSIQQTGRWLAKNFLMEEEGRSNKAKRKIRIVTDGRDPRMATALQLNHGMTQILQEAGIGLSKIEIDELLFRPTQKSYVGGGETLCEDLLSKRTWEAELVVRLGHVKTPGSLQDSMEHMKTLVKLHEDLTKASESSIRVEGNDLSGAINILTNFGETILDARSSDLLPKDWASEADIYKFINWFQWVNNVVHNGNSEATRRGVVLMEAIRQALQQDKTYMTIFVGEDVDLAHVSSALNVSWTLPTYGHNNPTPPGSAMHFYNKDHHKGAVVQIDYLYPNHYVTQDYQDANELHNIEIGTVDGLETRLLNVLRTYDSSAMNCLYKAHLRYRTSTLKEFEQSAESWVFPVGLIMLGLSIMLFGLSLYFSCFHDKRGNKKKKRQELMEEYMDADPRDSMEQFEVISLKDANGIYI